MNEHGMGKKVDVKVRHTHMYIKRRRRIKPEASYQTTGIPKRMTKRTLVVR